LDSDQIGVAAAIKQFLATKEERREATKDNLEQRLGLWPGQLEPGRKVHDVSTAELEAWLLTYKPQNRKNYRSALHGFFTWAVKIGAAPENPVTDVEIPEVKGKRPSYLHPADVQAMLKVALEQERRDTVTWIVLGAFCGLRPFESFRVEWHAIKRERQEIRIETEWSKIKRPRTFELTDLAMAWISIIPEGDPGDKILGHTEDEWNNKWQEWRKENAGKRGVPPWKLWQQPKSKDILRHTYITFRVADTDNEPLVAKEAGTSVEVIHAQATTA